MTLCICQNSYYFIIQKEKQYMQIKNKYLGGQGILAKQDVTFSNVLNNRTEGCGENRC